jgi:hypothetical protein
MTTLATRRGAHVVFRPIAVEHPASVLLAIVDVTRRFLERNTPVTVDRDPIGMNNIIETSPGGAPSRPLPFPFAMPIVAPSEIRRVAPRTRSHAEWRSRNRLDHLDVARLASMLDEERAGRG